MDTKDSNSGARILLVEDEVLVRLFAVDALEDAGFRVSEAGTATDALRALAETQGVRAAVVDFGLPDRSGDVLADEMRQRYASLPILIASGRSEKELRERFSGDRQIAVLVKPYTASMLVEALGSLGVSAS